MLKRRQSEAGLAFKYSRANECRLPTDLVLCAAGCSCKSCQASTCSCYQHTHDRWQTECGPACSCSLASCKLRTSQQVLVITVSCRPLPHLCCQATRRTAVHMQGLQYDLALHRTAKVSLHATIYPLTCNC